MQNFLSINLGTEPFKGFGPLGLEQNQDPGSVFNNVLSTTVGLMTIIAFIWFLFLLITGAFALMQAGEDAKALEGAKKKILNAIYALVFIIGAIFLVRLIGFLLGIDNILNPGQFLENLQ